MFVRYFFSGILVCCLFFAISVSLQSQETPAPAATPAPEASATPGAAPAGVRPDGRPFRRNRLNRSRARLPRGVFGEEADLPAAPDTVLGGTVPAIWEIERSSPDWDDEYLPSVIERDSPLPPVPAKIIRYAEWLMEHYDSNADGVLQSEEWKAMPGTPQTIDIDGDSRITLEELIRHLALYSRERTIHRPVPAPRSFQARVSGDLRLFQPVAPPPPPEPEPPAEVAQTTGDEAGKNEIQGPRSDDLSVDMTEEAMAADDKEMDDESYEEIIAGRQVPAEKKYATPPELYKGLPAWFFFRDRDGDGQVSLVEFAPTLHSSALALFGKLDKNGDGFITPDELRAPAAPSPPPEEPAAPPPAQ